MPLPVSLDTVAEELGIQRDDSTVYINRKTGEIFPMSRDEAALVEEDVPEDALPGWQAELLPTMRDILRGQDWVWLPNKFAVHEWEIMRRFAESVKSERLAERLNRAVHGRGAFRVFRDAVHDAGVEKQWYRFRHQELREIAREALERLGIPYDASSRQADSGELF